MPTTTTSPLHFACPLPHLPTRYIVLYGRFRIRHHSTNYCLDLPALVTVVPCSAACRHAALLAGVTVPGSICPEPLPAIPACNKLPSHSAHAPLRPYPHCDIRLPALPPTVAASLFPSPSAGAAGKDVPPNHTPDRLPAEQPGFGVALVLTTETGGLPTHISETPGPLVVLV